MDAGRLFDRYRELQSYVGWTDDDVYFPVRIEELPSNPDEHKTIRDQLGRVYTITAKASDPCTPAPEFLGGNGHRIPLTLYTLELLNPEGGTQSICQGKEYINKKRDACEQGDTGKELTGKVVAVPGRWSYGDGSFHSDCPEDGGTTECFTVSCLTGAVGTCAHWGYVPTFEAPDAGLTRQVMQHLHQACVRAARADYGSGQTFTCRGAYIDVVDGYGIQTQDSINSNAGVLSFEAAWSDQGAVPFGVSSDDGGCVRPRFNGCDPRINSVLEKRGPSFQADTNCQPPPPRPEDLRDYFDGGTSFVLLTRTWQNESCGGQCIADDRGVSCPNPRGQPLGPLKATPATCQRDGGTP